jgi:hypothetical protein
LKSSRPCRRHGEEQKASSTLSHVLLATDRAPASKKRQLQGHQLQRQHAISCPAEAELPWRRRGTGRMECAKFSALCDWPVSSCGTPPPRSPRPRPPNPSSTIFLTFGTSNLHQPPPQSPLHAIATCCNCLPPIAAALRYHPKMFRNALRQSTRAVGALSVSSRVAVVSPPPHIRPALDSAHRRPHTPSMASRAPCKAQLSFFCRCSAAASPLGACWALAEFCSCFWRLSGPGPRLILLSAAKCRTRRLHHPHIRRREGIANRGLVHPRAADSRCSG